MLWHKERSRNTAKKSVNYSNERAKNSTVTARLFRCKTSSLRMAGALCNCVTRMQTPVRTKRFRHQALHNQGEKVPITRASASLIDTVSAEPEPCLPVLRIVTISKQLQKTSGGSIGGWRFFKSCFQALYFTI